MEWNVMYVCEYGFMGRVCTSKVCRLCTSEVVRLCMLLSCDFVIISLQHESSCWCFFLTSSHNSSLCGFFSSHHCVRFLLFYAYCIPRLLLLLLLLLRRSSSPSTSLKFSHATHTTHLTQLLQSHNSHDSSHTTHLASNYESQWTPPPHPPNQTLKGWVK